MRRVVTVGIAMLIGGLVSVERGMAEGRPAANRPEIKEVGGMTVTVRTVRVSGSLLKAKGYL